MHPCMDQGISTLGMAQESHKFASILVEQYKLILVDQQYKLQLVEVSLVHELALESLAPSIWLSWSWLF